MSVFFYVRADWHAPSPPWVCGRRTSFPPLLFYVSFFPFLCALPRWQIPGGSDTALLLSWMIWLHQGYLSIGNVTAKAQVFWTFSVIFGPFSRAFCRIFRAPRSPGPGLGLPPLPVGGTYRAWELLCSVCDRVPPTPGRRPFVAGEREGKQDQPNFVARGGRGGPGGFFACGFCLVVFGFFFVWCMFFVVPVLVGCYLVFVTR